MCRQTRDLCALTAAVAITLLARPASAQIVEATGSRALGMAGAFVAVASDSSATWWNPAGLAAGPFLDMALPRAFTEVVEGSPIRRDRVSGFTLGTPPFGASLYRLRITDIRQPDPIVNATGDRQEGLAGMPVRALAATQLGVSLVHSVASGVHVGTTLKYLRGTLRGGVTETAMSSGDALDAAEDLTGGPTQNRFDLDIGVLAVGGPLRLGATLRNVRQVAFGDEAAATLRLPRQARVGIAFDGAQVGGVPFTIALDADVRRYSTVAGERRVLAVGAEQWLFTRRVGVRAGVRFNRVGARDRATTAGGSIALRSGFFLDGHVVRGGADEERGWGAAARVSF